MLQTLFLYWEILWRRRQPSELPYSWPLCLGTAMVVIALGVGINRYAPDFTQVEFKVVDPGAPALVIVACVVGLESLGYGLLLRLFGFAPRALQTVTAILGVSLFTSVAALALLLAGILAAPGEARPPALVAVVLIAVYIYDLYIKSWVFVQASERPLPLVVGLVLLLQLGVVLLVASLLGPTVEMPTPRG